MNFEEPSLIEYLVRNLQPLTKADPAILAKYVVALLKKDRSTEVLQKICADNLVEFLGQNAKSFTAKLFQALEDGFTVRADSLNVVNQPEASQPVMTVETRQLECPPIGKKRSISSELISDDEEKEMSDDDDRNHKHRRREFPPHSMVNNFHNQPIGRPNRTQNKSEENDQEFLESGSQLSRSQTEGYSTPGRSICLQFDKRHLLSGSLLQAPFNERGRENNTISWHKHNSRFFNPIGTLDYTSEMASGGSAHPSIFLGAGLQCSASSQNTSSGGFGMVRPPTISIPSNLGTGRQICRDFEEKGFCLRGDFCPMDHGVVRLVVQDVQNLSNVSIPVSVPTSNSFGNQSVFGPSTVHAASSLLTKSKVRLNSSKHDPVLPLWKTQNYNSKPTNTGDEWKADASVSYHLRLSDGIGKSSVENIDAKTKTSSVWSRLGPRVNSESGSKRKFRHWHSRPSKASYSLHVHKIPQTENRLDTLLSYFRKYGTIVCIYVVPKNGTAFVQFSNKEEAKAALMSPDAVMGNRFIKLSWAHFDRFPVDVEGTAEPESVKPPNAVMFSEYMCSIPSSKARCSLHVYGAPLRENRFDALLSHFRKFGTVVSICVPPNNVIAFVQFSNRKEAEAAIKSPDVVMGNRFVTVKWANYDRFPVDLEGNAHLETMESHNAVRTSISSPQLGPDNREETYPSLSKQIDHTKSDCIEETPFSGSRQLKVRLTNVPKAAVTLPNKVESYNLPIDMQSSAQLGSMKLPNAVSTCASLEQLVPNDRKGTYSSSQQNHYAENEYQTTFSSSKQPKAVLAPLPNKLKSYNRILVDVQSSDYPNFVKPPNAVSTTISAKQLVHDCRKETYRSSSQQKVHTKNECALETPFFISGQPDVLLTNAPSVAYALPNKEESFELLEEIRRKQEILDKKHAELQHQLEKIQKQDILVNEREEKTDSAYKRYKIDVGSEDTKSSDPRNCQVIETAMENEKPEGVLVTVNLKEIASTLQQSQDNIDQINSLAPPLANSLMDNCSTPFRALPPLLAEYANDVICNDSHGKLLVPSQ